MSKKAILATLVAITIPIHANECYGVEVCGVDRIFTATESWESMSEWLNDVADTLTESQPLTADEVSQLVKLDRLYLLNNPDDPEVVNVCYRIMPVEYYVEDDVQIDPEDAIAISDVVNVLQEDNNKRLTSLHNPATLGELLQEYMDSYELSVEALAAAMRRHPTELHALMSGESPMDIDWANRLARVFDSTAEYWLTVNLRRQVWDAKQNLAQYTGIPSL